MKLFGVLESQGMQAEHGSTQHVGRLKKNISKLNLAVHNRNWGCLFGKNDKGIGN
jgi:hypothetical protein